MSAGLAAAAPGRCLRHVAAEQAERFGPRLLQVHAGIGEHLSRDALLFPEQTQQQMLGPHIGVVQLPGLGHGQLEYLLGPRGVRQIGAGRRSGFPFLYRLFDLLLDVFKIDVQVGEDCRRHPFALTDEAEEDVLRPHVFVMQTRRLFAGHLQDFADPIGKIVAVHRDTLRSSEAPSSRLIHGVPLRIPTLCARTVPVGPAARDRSARPPPPPPDGPAACRPTTC